MEGVILPGVGESLLCPGVEDDVETFLEAFPTLPVRNAIALVGSGETAAPDAEIQATLADLIDGGSFFGHADGVAERQHIDGDAHPQLLSTGSHRTGHDERGGDDRRHARAKGIQWAAPS